MRNFLFSCVACCWLATPAPAQLLDGEFGDVDLGRELIEPTQFPTVRQLRDAVAKPKMEFVLLLKLYGDDNNHHLPVWSPDGTRLALQRSRRGVNSSKLLVYDTLAMPEPRLLNGPPDAFDYMFRWGLNAADSFVFARIESGTDNTRLFYSATGEEPRPLMESSGQYFYPSLYERTDGVRWLAYEQQGTVVHRAWRDEQAAQTAVTSGSAPRWSQDGRRLLLVKHDQQPGRAATYAIGVRHLREERDIAVASKPGVVMRSPSWSPNETQSAYFEREAREDASWRLVVCSADGSGEPKTIANDVIVNPDFKSEGPTWEASGQRIWCFSQAHRQQEFYPLVAADTATGGVTLVDYPRRATSPNDLAVNPATAIPELAFVAHAGLTQDLFVIFLNHF